ncbi:MAG: DUF4416 family protein [Fibrobacterota bacterium]
MNSAPKFLEPVKIFTGLILSAEVELAPVRSVLEAVYGPADYTSPEMDFSKYTPYYHDEMGTGLRRVFLSFERLEDRTLLPDIKHRTRALEADFAANGKRRVNLDPGYMTLGQLFLASTKNNFFRIYIRDGIFEEVTLYFKQGDFRPFPWTYPDYDSGEYKRVFVEIREIYERQLRFLSR